MITMLWGALGREVRYMRFSEIVQQLGAAEASSLETHPDRDPEIVGMSAIEQPLAHTLSYIESRKYQPYIATTLAQGLILPPDPAMQAAAAARGLVWIGSRHPRLAFAEAIALFYQPQQPAPGIHPTAIIDPSAQLGRDVAIGPYAVIQADVVIGDGVCIHPAVVVYPQVEIGDRTILYAQCVIHERTRIGRDCVIHSGAIIGAEGFGFVPQGDGTWFKMQQSGYTVLEDAVEIGCNTAVDRPAVGETRIGPRTKIDNGVQVGHDAKIGADCILPAQIGMAGGVKIEDQAVLGGRTGINNRVVIGRAARVTAGSLLMGDVPPGTVVSGYPAMPHRTWLKSAALTRKLPDMQQTLKQMQQQIAALQIELATLREQGTGGQHP